MIFNAYGAIRNSPVPVIGVVQGRALGFGCAVAAVCDITLASDKAQFQVPEMAHNILPTMVMSSFVDRVPRKAFTYLVYSTAVIGAERALSFGIVSDVVPAGAARATVDDRDGGDPQGAANRRSAASRNMRALPSTCRPRAPSTSRATSTRWSIRRRKSAASTERPSPEPPRRLAAPAVSRQYMTARSGGF